MRWNSAIPADPVEARQRIAVAQIDAVFAAIPVGVTSAALAAIVLAAGLWSFGFTDARTGFFWSLYIASCALCHILLNRAYRRSGPVRGDWPKWAFWFTVIAFGEGIGWGWAPIGLAAGSRLDVELIVLIVCLVVAEGAMLAFGPYLPAFYALFLPATVPYLFVSAVSPNALERVTSVLTLVYIGGVGSLAYITNRSFKQLVGLRIRTEAMAQDLQAQKDIAERQKVIAEEASLAKSAFLAAASHDLRQPVHALGMFVGALRGVPMLPEGRRILEQIETSTTAMEGLFTALLDISRLDAGVVAVQKRPFAIGPLLDRVCRDHRQEAIVKGVSLVCKPCAAIVATDPLLMERILRNLVSNAVRYTDRGRIVVGCRRRSAAMSVQVWDTGRGIPMEQQERVFQEYYQLGNPERDRTKGLGLGLAIVRRLTRLLEAPLTLRSTPSRGSCFEVTIPLADRETEFAEPEPEVASRVLARGLVVVIDDELAVREATAVLLTGWGYDVVAAGSGDDAILRLSARPAKPELILSDYRLRDQESGVEAIKRIRAEYGDTIPAILITGDTAPTRLAEAEASGLLLMHKPVSNGKLRAAIVNLTAKGPPRLLGAGLSPVK